MDWKRLGKKLLFPPIWVIIILAIFSMVALIFVFVKGWDSSWAASMVYVLAFYSLTVCCLSCWKKLPEYYKRIKGKQSGDMSR